MNSGDDAIQLAVTALLAKLEAQEDTVRETKKTINNLLHHIGKTPMFPDAEEPSIRTSLVIRPDQFYGRPLATVAKEVLEMRGQAMSAAEIITALESGGFDFERLGWKESDRLRSFTITLAKNIAAFHRLPTGYFGLPKWYPEAIKQKQAAKAGKEATQTESASEDDTDLETQA